MVGVSLDVGVTTLGVHAATRTADIPEQQLEYRAGADQLPAGRVMGQADRVDDRHHLVRLAHLADQLGDPQELVLRDAGDARDHLRRVAGVVLLHELENGLRVLQRHVPHRDRRGGASGGKRLLASAW